MNNIELQKLRDLPIEGVAERLGLQVSRHKSLCPFHDDRHPSMSYHTKRNTFRCFVCGASGGTIDLVMRHLNIGFLDACRWLADEHNIIVDEWKPCVKAEQQKPFDASRYERFFERPWLSPEARQFLFDERRIDPRVARWCRLTSWRDKQGVSWLQIPYYDMEGKLVGVQNRNITKASNSSTCQLVNSSTPPPPRFRFPYGAKCTIYNLPVMKMLKPQEPLYITEGCSDCWAMLSAGNKAIAIPSATLLNAKDIELLSAITSRLSTSLHMYPDCDEPGERLFMQLKQLLPNLEHHQLPLGYKDFGEWWGKSLSPALSLERGLNNPLLTSPC